MFTPYPFFFVFGFCDIIAYMAMIMNGNLIAGAICKDIRFKIDDLKNRGLTPRLVVVLVGDNPASVSYVRIKHKKAVELGIEVDVKKYPVDVTQKKLLEDLETFNHEKDVRGIIVQLPLPNHLDREAILNAIDPKLDVDCLTGYNKEKLIKGQEPNFYPPSPCAILKVLDYYQVDLKKGNVLLIGSGDLVGKPLAAMLLSRKVNFELANKHTENLPELVAKADVIITGVGKARLITGNMVKDGVVVIDAGTTGSEAGVVGDVDFESVAKKASFIAPVPGGVGPVTVAMLLRNVVDRGVDTIFDV